MAQRVRCAQQRLDQLRRELAASPRVVEHVLDRVREHLDLTQPEHPGRSLDRVRVAKE